ncbi:nucleoside triphosphate pyrophosphohydrolase [candidate division KSB1 bacterium]
MKEFDRLVEVMRRVKSECPWDRKQTHDTLRQYFIEETFEVIDAIDEKDDSSLAEELGDVQCQILFHSLLAEDRGKFTISDVMTILADKMVRRHPHVFGDTVVNGSEDVLQNWEHIKMNEGKKESVLDGVPKEMPALIKAYRIQSKAGRVGFDWPDIDGVINKVFEELAEFKESVEKNNRDEIEDELGDLLFSLVNTARKLEVNPEDALRRTIRKFDKRFRFIEKSLKQQGKDLKKTSLEEMDKLWDEAKVTIK